jgi:hypothetical protein
MSKRVMMLATVTAAALALSACGESATSPFDSGPDIAAADVPTEGNVDLAALDQPGGDGSLFNELAKQIPGFGGLWFDRHCNLNVVLTRPGEQSAVAEDVLAPYLRRYVESHRCPDTAATILVHQGEFDWDHLSTWLRLLAPASGFPGVARIGISVPLNRIVVAVDGRPTAHEVLRLADHIGVPAAALKFVLAATDRRTDRNTTDRRTLG